MTSFIVTNYKKILINTLIA